MKLVSCLAAAVVSTVFACAAPRAKNLGDVKLVEPGGAVAVSQVPDGLYLRSVNDPSDDIWRRLPEYRAHLSLAPPVHRSVQIRYEDNDPGQDVVFQLARTSDRLYVRMRWNDASRDIETKRDAFRDGAAVEFSDGSEQTSYIMGSDDQNAVISGTGERTTTSLNPSPRGVPAV